MIKAYLRLPNPTVRDRDAAAKEIGLSIWQFGRLAEAWRLHKRPSLLATSASTSRRGAPRRDGIDDAARKIVEQAIGEVGTQGRNQAVQKLVVERSREAGIAPPSTGSVWNMLMEARRQATQPSAVCGSDREATIVVGRLWLDLPVILQDETLVRPEMLVAVLLPEGEIAAVELAFGGAPPSLAGIVRKLTEANDPRTPERRMVATPVDALGLAPDGWPTVTRSGDAQASVARTFGRGIGRIDVRYRRVHTAVERLLKARHDEPLDAADAELAVDFAVREHNARRTATVFASVSAGDRLQHAD